MIPHRIRNIYILEPVTKVQVKPFVQSPNHGCTTAKYIIYWRFLMTIEVETIQVVAHRNIKRRGGGAFWGRR